MSLLCELHVRGLYVLDRAQGPRGPDKGTSMKVRRACRQY